MNNKSFERLCTLYDHLKETATEEDGYYVWSGSLTAVVEDLGLKRSRYSQLVGTLQDMGCMTQIQRGGGTAPSVWVLKERPSLELVERYQSSPTNPRVGRPKIVEQRLIAVEEQVKAMAYALSALENRHNALAAALAENVLTNNG